MTPLLHLFPFSVSLYRQGASSRDWYRRTGWHSVISSTLCIPQDNHRRWHVIETQHFHTQWLSLLPRLYPGSLQSPALPSFLPNKRTRPEIPGLGLNPSPFLTLYTAKLSWPLFWPLPSLCFYLPLSLSNGSAIVKAYLSFTGQTFISRTMWPASLAPPRCKSHILMGTRQLYHKSHFPREEQKQCHSLPNPAGEQNVGSQRQLPREKTWWHHQFKTKKGSMSS